MNGSVEFRSVATVSWLLLDIEFMNFSLSMFCVLVTLVLYFPTIDSPARSAASTSRGFLEEKRWIQVVVSSVLNCFLI